MSMPEDHDATLEQAKIVEGAPPALEPVPIKELRLALVCYGGVSLAIYMHGVTKEIHKLVQASAAFEHDQQGHQFAATDTAAIYWTLLKKLHDGEVPFPSTSPHAGGDRPHTRDRVRTRVTVDIVAGTSAGGINGMFLAKAVAGNLSQDALKDLWLNRGDISGLLSGPAWLPAWARGAWFALKTPVNIMRRRDTAPLRGDQLCAWLHAAFASMDRRGRAVPGVESLVPADHSLNLFVPITDFHGYRREFPLDDPKYVLDRTHRHVLEFRHNPLRKTESYFGPEYNHVLAFAARATSSFPGAFPPIGFNDYARNFQSDPGLRRAADPMFREYALAHEDPSATQFVDGGVLDNAPFESAIRTISLKPAACQVDRRLLYVEPDPEEIAAASGAVPKRSQGNRRDPEERRKRPPTWLGTIWGGLTSIPRNEPIVDDLRTLARRNEAVARVRDVIEVSFRAIEARVFRFFTERLQVSALPQVMTRVGTYAEMQGFAGELEVIAAEEAGFSYATYLRLRARSLVDNYASVIGRLRNYPAGSNHLAFVHAVVRLWLIGERDASYGSGPPPALFSSSASRHTGAAPYASLGTTGVQHAFLSANDIWYHERRTRFLISALNWWYRDRDLATGDVPPPPRGDLDRTKKRLYEYLKALDDILGALQDDAAVARLLNELFDDEAVRTAALAQDAKGYVERHRGGLDQLSVALHLCDKVPELEAALYGDLIELTTGWPDAAKAALLVRYLGFPFWDILVFPIQAMSAVGERDAVETIRMSPRDARLLQPPDDAPKLRGTALHHFWGFFTREGRENDYLWGRLDAAERLIALLLDDPSRPSLDAIVDSPRAVIWQRHSKEAFTAILEEEERALPRSAELVRGLRGQVARL